MGIAAAQGDFGIRELTAIDNSFRHDQFNMPTLESFYALNRMQRIIRMVMKQQTISMKESSQGNG